MSQKIIKVKGGEKHEIWETSKSVLKIIRTSSSVALEPLARVAVGRKELVRILHFEIKSKKQC
jgi:hypothetical protein